MLKSLEIKNFRCFESFRLEQLGQVNLLVGSNNSGKTSILEALYLLYSPASLEALCNMMIDRGEYIFNDGSKEPISDNRELDIRHLFYNHEIQENFKIIVVGNDNNDQKHKVVISVKKDPKNHEINRHEKINMSEYLYPAEQLVLNWVWATKKAQITIGLSANQGFIIAPYMPRIIQNDRQLKIKTEFVKSSSLTTIEMIKLFDRVVLTSEEDVITEALQKIEPGIDRIATVASNQSRNSVSKSGFVVRLSETKQRIPIGSMGDGIWRILGLILAIVNVKNGVLLVDEIDTGLHYSVMLDMWTIICQVAKRLNVQVFATTHNSDCWKSLATVANSENYLENGITIHRIEKGKPASIIFDEQEMMIAAERDIEVR